MTSEADADAAIVEERFVNKKQKRPSAMTRKFQLAAEGGEVDVDIFQNYVPSPPPTVWFFYGSLMDPSTLQSVLSLAERPKLRPANLPGYHLKMWGQYPALIDGRPLLTVPGMVFEAGEHNERSKDVLAKLQTYEGENYKCRLCSVEYVGQEGVDVRATTFQWIGDTTELKAGSFDLKDYQMSRIEKEVE
jgi:gamma-glutamylcyclotransferase (GGCT)/AIG2-like uncharacterized protein YtfP